MIKKHRTLRVTILMIFLTILVASFSCMMWYIYNKNKEVVLDFSRSLMSEVSVEVITHIEDLLKKMEQFSKIEKYLILKESDVSLDNKPLLGYMFNAVQLVPNLSILHAAAANGTWIGQMNLLAGSSYRNNPAKVLPPDYAYAIQYIDRNGPVPKETWIYQNQEGEEVGREEVKEITFDPRKRPWFIGAEEKKRPYWTDVYVFDITKRPGISIGYPIYNEQNELIAISGGDIELAAVDQFLVKLKIGKSGKVMILTDKGDIVADPDIISKSDWKKSFPKLLSIKDVDNNFSRAFDRYKLKGEESFIFEDKGVEYLASFVPYTAPSKSKFLIAIVVPADDFLAQIIHIQENLYLFSIIIVVIAAIMMMIFSKSISKPIVKLAEEANKIRHLNLEDEISVETSIKEIYQMKVAMSSMKSALKSFGRYVPKEIVRELLDQGKEIKLGGERKELTIFFSDITSFTSFSEKLSTEKVMEQISRYLSVLSNVILENQGTIDKYIGDGVMAFWGAPKTIGDGPVQACRSALICQKRLSAVNAEWVKAGKPPLNTRIGIHVGLVIVGNIGTDERMNYTVMGDSVNLASRLEGVNKAYRTQIIISEEVLEKLDHQFLVRPLDEVAIRGKENRIRIYELVAEFEGSDELKPTASEIELCTLFAKAYKLHREKNDAEAKVLFASIHEKFPHDYPTEFYLNQLNGVK